MIGRKGVIGCRKLGTAKVGKLLGMQFDRKAILFCSLENPIDLLDGKGDAFAKTVNRIRQSVRMGFFQPRQNDRCQPRTSPVRISTISQAGFQISEP